MQRRMNYFDILSVRPYVASGLDPREALPLAAGRLAAGSPAALQARLPGLIGAPLQGSCDVGAGHGAPLIRFIAALCLLAFRMTTLNGADFDAVGGGVSRFQALRAGALTGSAADEGGRVSRWSGVSMDQIREAAWSRTVLARSAGEGRPGVQFGRPSCLQNRLRSLRRQSARSRLG